MEQALLRPMMIAALLVSGMGVAILGSIKVPLARRLRIDEARVGGLVSLFGFILIPAIFTAGFLTDHVSRQTVLIGGSALMTASLVLLAAARTYPAALAAVVLLSAGWSLLINVGNVLIPIAFAGKSLAYSFNLGNVFFGLGAFLTPLAAALLLRHATLPLALGVLAGLSVVPAALALGVDFLAPGLRLAPPAETAVTWGALLADPILWLSGLALFFYGPLEASMGAWATTYLSDQGVSEGTASALLSAFWLVYMGTRLTTALTLPQGHERTLILVLALAAVLVLLAMVLSRNRVLAMTLVIAAGLVFGPIFPTTVGVLLGHFHASVHGRAVGMFFAIGGVGWTMIPLLIGAYARRTSVQRGFWVAVAAAVGLSLVAAILYKAAL